LSNTNENTTVAESKKFQWRGEIRWTALGKKIETNVAGRADGLGWRRAVDAAEACGTRYSANAVRAGIMGGCKPAESHVEEREENGRFACHRLLRARAPLLVAPHAPCRPLPASSRRRAELPADRAGWVIAHALSMAYSDLLKVNVKTMAIRPSLGPILVYSTTLITTMMSDRSR